MPVNVSSAHCWQHTVTANQSTPSLDHTLETMGRDEVNEDVQLTEGGLFTITSRLKYYAKYTDDQMYVTCFVTHEAIDGRLSASAKIDVDCKL